MAPTDFGLGQAPNITNIAFNRPFLPFDETQKITVTAQLRQGLGQPPVGSYTVLVGGGGATPEGMIYMPLWFGSGDLYDDGSHGDLVKGDGIYTNDTIMINKWSEFYLMNPLPKKVGLRLIAKNNDSHYTIADTEFMVGNPGGLSVPATLHLLLD